MGSADSADSFINTSSSSVVVDPPSLSKKRHDVAPSSGLRNGGSIGGKGKIPYGTSSQGYSTNGAFPSTIPRQRNAKEESYAEGSSNAVEKDTENVFKLTKSDFPEYLIRHGWQSPKYNVIKGQVQPRVIPPPGKPTRHTNVLEFLWKKVMKKMMKHKHAWPFQFPVDVVQLPHISNYHSVIKRPMDLTTIENRLKHQYYICGAECIRDFEQVWSNCYKYNDLLHDVSIMCKQIETEYRDKIKDIPKEEFEIPLKGGFVSRLKNTVPRGNVVRTPSLASKKETDTMLKYLHNATVQGSVDKSDSTIHTNGASDDLKRKGDPIVGVPAEKRFKIRNRPMPDYSQMTPRWKGKYPPRMQGCVKIINDLMTKKAHRMYANPFQLPVDVEKFQLHDYYDVIKKPMDLSSVKKQLDYKLYGNAEEFRDDVLLIFQNCFKFNRANDIVHTAGLQLLEAFDEKFSKLPPESETSVTKPPKARPASSWDNSMVSMNGTMETLNTSALFAPLPSSPALPALDLITRPSLIENPTSRSAPPKSGVVYEACDDDEMIQALMMRIQMQNLVYTEKMSVIQRLSQDLLTLQMHRIAACATKCTAVQPPILSSEAVTRIMNIFDPTQCMPIPMPTLTQEQLDVLRNKGLKVGSTPRASNIPRIIGEVPPPSSAVQPTPFSRKAFRASPTSPRKKSAPTKRAVLSSSDTEDDAAPVSKRRVKKPKIKESEVKKEKTINYDFKSDDESMHAPLSYDEKRVVSMNVESISPEAVAEIIRIIEYREHVTGLGYCDEIDFDKMRPVTLRELNALATTVLMNRGQKVYAFGVDPEMEPIVKPTQPATKSESSGIPNGFEVKTESAPAPSKPKVSMSNPNVLDDLKLSSSDSSDSSSSDDSSSSSGSSSSDSDSSDSETETEKPETKCSSPNVKAPIANGVNNNSVNRKTVESAAKVKVSPQNSSSTCSPVNANGFGATKGVETPCQLNAKPSLPKPASKPVSTLSCDPLSLLDAPTIPKIEKPALPRNMTSGTSSFGSTPATAPRNTYRQHDRVDLSSQISLMANFEENF